MATDNPDGRLTLSEEKTPPENSDLYIPSTKGYIFTPNTEKTKLEPSSPPPISSESAESTDAILENLELSHDAGEITPEKEEVEITNPIAPNIDAKKVEDINIAGGDIYNIYNQNSAKNKSETLEESFTDPTQCLSNNPSKIAVFHSPDELDEYRRKWDEDRLLLLGGINEDILLSTAYHLIEQKQYDTYEKRQLNFDDYNSELTGLKLEMFRRYRIGRGKKMIVLIDIEEQCEFYDSILKTQSSAQSIKEYLQKNEILLIALVKNHLISMVEEKEGKGFYFSYWKIDFLPHLLRNFYSSEANLLEGKILQQKEKELWGDKKDDYEFHNNVFAELKKGKVSFLAEVERRQKYLHTSERPEEIFGNTWKTRTREIFKDSEPHKTVLYCGAFFSKLPPLDFDKMVRLLLSGKIAATGKTAKIITDTGEDKTIETNEQKEAVEIWLENSDKIIKECNLKVKNDDNSPQYIGLSQSYLENDLKKFFQEDQPMYMMHQFRPIQESGILFVSDISPNISNNIIRLAAQMAILNPAYYGVDWLKDFIRQLRAKFNIQDTASSSIDAAVFRYIENTTNKIIRMHFYTQISKLTREMLNHQQLKVVVKSFLNHLFTIDAHDAVLHIVLNLGGRMFPVRRAEFDMFYWLRRLLDQGPDHIKNEAYEALHDIAIKNHHDIYIVMESIREWIPPTDMSKTNLSPSNTYALLFIIHYCYGTLLRMKDKHYGRWPSNYPLFRPLSKDKSQLEQLKRIIRWLLHPHTQKAAEKRNASAHTGDQSGLGFDLYNYMALILEEWGMILLGWDYKKEKQESVDLFHTLIGYIISLTSPSEHKKILNYLARKRIDYKNQFIQITDKIVDKRKKLISRYKMLGMIINLYKHLTADYDRRETL